MINFTKPFKLTVLFILIFLQSLSLIAQVQTARVKKLSLNVNGFYEYLPEGYGSGSQTYSLIIFCHGMGEMGNGGTQLSKVLNTGLPRLIKDGKFPKSFTVNNQTHKFVVISPQFAKWPGPGDIDAVLDYALANYKVDPTRVYITGLSMGGGITWEYSAHVNLYAKRLAAIVPICGASWPDKTRAYRIADAKLPVWATHNNSDPTVPSFYTNDYISHIKTRNSSAPVKKTIFISGSHDAWTKTYDPNFREGGLNIYEWMLQYTRGGATAPAPVANKVPVAQAGSDVTLKLPSNSVELNGSSSSDADGTISKYSWTKVSGPSQFSISNAAGAKPVVSNLVAGTYVVNLTVTDNSGAQASDQLTITVQTATNISPAVSSGNDVSVTLPTRTVTVSGTASDVDGSITSLRWTKTSGPNSFSIPYPTSLSTKINDLSEGIYIFRLTATDNSGASSFDEIKITVNKATVANVAPTVSAGTATSITLPTNTTTLKGTASDVDGSIVSTSWTRLSGPNTPVFSSSSSLSTQISGLIAGTYTFNLTCKDDDGASATSSVQVVVLAAAGGGSITPTTGSIVNVNIIGNSDSYGNSQWNNWDVVTATGSNASQNINSVAFKYSTGLQSTISANLSHSQTVTLNTPYSGGMAPMEVLKTVSYSSTNRTLTIKGLKKDKYYDIELYSSRSNSNNNTLFRVNGQAKTILAANNYNNEAAFANLRSNSKGELVIDIIRQSTFNYINGFKIVEKSSMTTTLLAASTAGSEMASLETKPDVDVKGSMTVSPNPARESFQLQLSNPLRGSTQIQVIDLNGRIVEQFRTTKSADNLSQRFYFTQKYKSGNYFISVQIGKWKQSEKLIKL